MNKLYQLKTFILFKFLTLMKYIIILLFYSISCCGTQNSAVTNEQADSIIQSNIPKKMSLDTLTVIIDPKDKGRFYYLDDFENMIILDSIESKIILRHSHLQLTDGKNKISYILNKGENIEILYQGEYPTFKSKRDIRTVELYYPVEHYKKFDINFQNTQNFQRAMLDDIYTQNSALRDSIFKSQFNLELDFLKEFIKKNNLSDEFYQSYYSFLEYKYLERILMAGYFNFSKEYINYISKNAKNKLTKDENLFLSSYRNSLKFLFNIIYKKTPSVSYDKLINYNFSNKSKNYLLAMLIINAKKNKTEYNIPKDELDKLINDYTKNCQFPEDCSYLINNITIGNMTLKDDEVIDINLKQYSLRKINNNKITFIDFWASWCVPCITEMPYSKILQKKYNSKGINFIFISIDENHQAWEKAMKQIGLSDTESYLLPKVDESFLAKQFKIQSIPRYIIMDKDGKIINQEAPRPSDPKIMQIFEELLKK